MKQFLVQIIAMQMALFIDLDNLMMPSNGPSWNYIITHADNVL